jgi:hypothetical protein
LPNWQNHNTSMDTNATVHAGSKGSLLWHAIVDTLGLCRPRYQRPA